MAEQKKLYARKDPSNNMVRNENKSPYVQTTNNDDM